MSMKYQPLFNPSVQLKDRTLPTGVRPYVYDEAIERAINVALAARRPLLLLGEPGTGKSSLAAHVAFCLERRYEYEVVTSRTEARDLRWRFDAVRRLSDAQARKPGSTESLDDRRYVEPGVLWRAFNAPLAQKYGPKPEAATDTPVSEKEPVVVLLDEIDKAEPDVPNDLLTDLDARWFRVTDLGGLEVKAADTLDLFLVITSNGERELPSAFVRRCVVYRLPNEIGKDRLYGIAKAHFPDVTNELLNEVYKVHQELADVAKDQNLRRPSIAEFIDAIRATTELLPTKDGDEAPADYSPTSTWREVVKLALWKHRPSDGA
jgi:MoxR-like ATPase